MKPATLHEQDLAVEMCPKTVTVTGEGLIAWGARAKTGEIHIYRMDLHPPHNSKYTLHLLWLEGRTLYDHEEARWPDPSAPAAPARGNQDATREREALAEFKPQRELL